MIKESEVIYEDEYYKELGDMHGASSDEVLVTCLDKLCRVDLVEMSRSSGKSIKQLVLDLRGRAILQDPSFFEDEQEWDIEKGWVSKPVYCSGNLSRKLASAKDMNKRFPGCFDENIKAIKEILPKAVGIDEIHISIGAPWVPGTVYSEFLAYLLKTNTRPVVTLNHELKLWQVEGSSETKNSELNHLIYGTVHMSALEIFKHILNSGPIKITQDNGKFFNRDATIEVKEREKLIKAEFDKWICSDAKRCQVLEECYNDSLRNYGVSRFDGSFLTLPDLNPNVKLYPRQRDSIARILLSDEHQNHLLAQDVGAGKTYVMCVGIHELYRMNISKKNLMICPNFRLKSTVDDYKYLYPNDKILVVYPSDFNLEYRNETLKQIRDGDYACVFMAFSSFDMIVMSKEYWIDKLTKEYYSLHDAIACATYKFEKKALDRKQKRISKEISEYITQAVDTPWLTFDQLGIDTLIVDEAHRYKNIPLYSRSENIVGMHSKGAAKCKEMLEKTKVVKKVIFATATPITNSIADLFVMMSYLQPDELKISGIDSFDLWINTFGEKSTDYELDVDSNHLKEVTRFSKFHNLDELMALFSTVADFYYPTEKNPDLPDFNGYIDIPVPRNKAQEEGMKQLIERTELVRTGRVHPTEDNLLKITNYGRMLALHPGMVGLGYDRSEETDKVRVCAEKVYQLYREHPGACQIVFSDIGTPKAGFNVYDLLKQELVEMGIPDTEIAFVHDATNETARAKLFAQMNAGMVRVAIGSTVKLGEGVNVNERLVGIHHLSIPWRPGDLIQRNGRILRVGNTRKEVYIYRYVTEGSFDAYSWQLLQNKQSFISEFLSGACVQRDADDVADTILDYSEIKALAIGNPLIKTRVETSNLLERSKIAFR
ncbi:MAG: DEAD/DEAH box helicase family protein, partial [Clostridia bacterium]|nr:DEAD/DEAH box helicase family protein [Clostridia bacterium]